jgi:hypothetical protein
VRPLAAQIPNKVAAFAFALIVVLGVSIATGYARELAALPRAATDLRSASQAAGEVLSCLQGVQDELSGGRTPAMVTAAASALRLCDLRPLEERVRLLRLPPAAMIADSDHRAGRAEIDAAVQILERMILDARAARAAMRADLDGGALTVAIVLSYRSFASGDARSSALSAEASARLATPRPPG